MITVCGVVFAGGVLLTISPWLWPHRPTSTATSSNGALSRLLEDAGFAHMRPRVLVAVSVVLAVLAASIVLLIAALPALAVVAGLAGGAVPLMWLRARRRGLRRSRRGLWPDVCDLLIASVRAGMSLPDAVASLATSAPPALRPAFAAFDRDLAASGHFDSSALTLKATLADPVADRIVETLRMARQVGGTELTPVLRALASSVRADAALRAEVEAR